MINITIKVPGTLYQQIKEDLERPHTYAYERAGFAYGTQTYLTSGELIIFINEYEPIPDDQYIKTDEVGARINSESIRSSLQVAYSKQKCMFHVHLHSLTKGVPEFSSTDNESIPELVNCAQSFVPEKSHGMIVLSEDKANADILVPNSEMLVRAEKISIVGTDMNVSFPTQKLIEQEKERYSRQTFLGAESADLISRLKIGIVGLSGGGSHIVQQMSHIGFNNFVLSDPEKIDKSNLNRIVGATYEDVKKKRLKYDISKRVILNLHPEATVEGGDKKWEELTDQLKSCDLIFGCLDTIIGRRDLEAFCRRYFVSYIDIGMGIDMQKLPAIMYGQAQVSVPGKPCFKCNKFITEETLALEANNYGETGPRPQVVWPNGILASAAIGITMEMLTGWNGESREGYYLSYEGNKQHINDHIRLSYLPQTCDHYPIIESGPIEY